jgi:hypothetical protein
MMGIKLSHKLDNLGFFPALGTTERPGMTDERLVGHGTPYTYERNNGVLAVYDQHGRPWVALDGRDDEKRTGLRELSSEFELQIGAYVPHSNDGGQFLGHTLPSL